MVGHETKWAKNADIWPKKPFGRFWAKNPFFGGDEVKLLVPSHQGNNETPFLC